MVRPLLVTLLSLHVFGGFNALVCVEHKSYTCERLRAKLVKNQALTRCNYFGFQQQYLRLQRLNIPGTRCFRRNTLCLQLSKTGR